MEVYRMCQMLALMAFLLIFVIFFFAYPNANARPRHFHDHRVHHHDHHQNKGVKDNDIDLYGKMFGDHSKHEKKCLRNVFEDTLIVVVFNFPFYENIPILQQLYENVFGKIVYCGAKPESGTRQPNITVDVNNGYFGYICMARAIKKHPGFEGYLYVNDDMIVNWWNLWFRDRKKVWQGPEIVDFTQGAYEPIKNKQWIWWDSDMGISACQKSHKDLMAMAKSSDPSFDAKSALEIYLKNGNGKARCGKGWSDFFYVPGHLARTCQELLEINYKNHLFLEMSVMNLIHSLDYSENFEEIKGIFLPDLWLTNSKDSREFWGVYNTKLTFIHPFKLGFKEYKEMNTALVKNWILDITKQLTNC